MHEYGGAADDRGNRPASRGRRGRHGRDGHATNVAPVERVLSLAGGGALAIAGARRRDLPGGLMLLASALLLERGATGHCHLYGALDVTSDGGGRHRLVQQHGAAAVLDARHAIHVERTVTIARPREELYAFWRDFTNLPHVMQHLEAVTVLDAKRSRWKAKGPAGTSVEWDAVIHNERESELIAWKSEGDATVPNAGSVRFSPAPGDRGTEVRVVLDYDPPAGAAGRLVAKLFGEDPEAQVREDLRRFKAVMEAGEAPTIDGQSRAD